MSVFESVVMAGGGSRCLWHVGFWREAAEPLGLAPKQIACVSASSAMACAVVTGLGEAALELFKVSTSRNPRNVYWGNAFGSKRVFPHERMYRDAILALVDQEVLRKVHAGPDLRVLLGRVPRWLSPKIGFLTAAVAYNFDKRVRRLVHPTLPMALGFRPEVVSVRECTTPEMLTDLIIASSCIPPMITMQRWNGEYAIDGGAVDNVPVCALTENPGETLVLLTRVHPRLPKIPGRTYVQPSVPVPITTWDYANPAGLQGTYDQGRRDGEAFVRAHQRRLSA